MNIFGSLGEFRLFQKKLILSPVGVVAVKANQFFFLHPFVNLRLFNLLFIMALKTKGIADFLHQGLGLASMDIMADNAIHGRRAMDEGTAIF